MQSPTRGMDTAAAKRFATDMAVDVAGDAMQLMGG
jgi:alkylation response protein AidB-like acyl-CoA dehydrogenase